MLLINYQNSAFVGLLYIHEFYYFSKEHYQIDRYNNERRYSVWVLLKSTVNVRDYIATVMMDEYGALVIVEWYWQGKLKSTEENLTQWHFVHQKSHIDWLQALNLNCQRFEFTHFNVSKLGCCIMPDCFPIKDSMGMSLLTVWYSLLLH
jgi:hypothetical protein